MKEYYGEWTTPTSWDDLTLQQLMDIQALYANEEDRHVNIIDILHILTNHTKEEVQELPVEFLNRLLAEVEFLHTPLPQYEPSPSITINDETYAVNVAEKMRTGEFVAAQMALKNSGDYATLLAIIARKPGEVYNTDFENNTLASRVEMFKQAKVVEIMPLVAFFLQIWIFSRILSQMYGEVIEEADDLYAQLIRNSQTGGLGKKLFTKWQMRKLKKLMKSVKSMPSSSFNS